MTQYVDSAMRTETFNAIMMILAMVMLLLILLPTLTLLIPLQREAGGVVQGTEADTGRQQLPPLRHSLALLCAGTPVPGNTHTITSTIQMYTLLQKQ